MTTNHRSQRNALIAEADKHRDRREWASASRLYRYALDLDQTDSPIWVQYGNMSKELRNFSDAEDAYRFALTLDPNNADTYLQLGHLKKLMGQALDAKRAYEKSISLIPTARDAFVELLQLSGQNDLESLAKNSQLTDEIRLLKTVISRLYTTPSIPS